MSVVVPLAVGVLLAGAVVVARAQPAPAGVTTSGAQAPRPVARGGGEAVAPKAARPAFDAALDQRLVRRHRDGIALMVAGIAFTAGGATTYAIGDSGHAKISAVALVLVGVPAVVAGYVVQARACRARRRARGVAVVPFVTDRSVGVAVGGTLPW